VPSKIEWTEETWNFVTGCTKVSPGCDHCYAERITERQLGKGSFAEVRLLPARLDKPLHWRRPRRVFVNSMSDLFHEDVPDELLARAFAVMAASPEHVFQILTKRHGPMRARLSGEFPDWMEAAIDKLILTGEAQDRRARLRGIWSGYPWPLPNVWLGVSVESQVWAGVRIPVLLKTPAAVRWLSVEPLLGPLDLRPWLADLDWVVVGGESGPDHRPMRVEWLRAVVQQCVLAGVPAFVKQASGPRPGMKGDIPDELWAVKRYPQRKVVAV
jgi:protein gp37